MAYFHWTDEEDAYLINNFGAMTYQQLADELGRSLDMTKARVEKLKARGVLINKRHFVMQKHGEDQPEPKVYKLDVKPGEKRRAFSPILMKVIRGTVVYIHPKGRFAVLEYKQRYDDKPLRECFDPKALYNRG